MIKAYNKCDENVFESCMKICKEATRPIEDCIKLCKNKKTELKIGNIILREIDNPFISFIIIAIFILIILLAFIFLF